VVPIVGSRMYGRSWYTALSSVKMAAVYHLVVVTWLINPSRVLAYSVTEFRPASCPTDCLCGVGTSLSPLPVKGYFATVSCPNWKLAEYPAAVPPGTRILVLRGNALRSTATTALPARLAELDLSYNVIDDVTMTSPTHLLRHLDLQHNVVGSLSASSFAETPRLDVLLLGYNRLTRVDVSWFRPLVDLRWLSLAGNRLSTLKPDGFNGVLSHLTHLDLSHNALDRVPDDALSGLVSLRELDLSHNRIGRLSRRSFAGLKVLERLDLSGNRLDDVPTEALKVFEGLNALVLDDNPLTSLPTRRLTGFAARLISVSWMSRLRFVDVEAFFDVGRLTTVALHDNPRLAYVSEHFVGPLTTAASIVDVLLHRSRLTIVGNLTRALPALRQLTLFGNPLRCDCRNEWIQQTVIKSARISYLRLSFAL